MSFTDLYYPDDHNRINTNLGVPSSTIFNPLSPLLTAKVLIST